MFQKRAVGVAGFVDTLIVSGNNPDGARVSEQRQG
jgi:hypothetical protein